MSGILGPVGDLLGSSLSALQDKEDVVAQNLANLNTPGYQAQDVTFGATLQQALQTGSVDPTMVAAPGTANSQGNTVDINAQLGEINQVALFQEGDMSALQADVQGAATVLQDMSGPGV